MERWSYVVLALALGATALGCTDDIVSPDCDSALELVAHGSLDGRAIEVEAPDLTGRWLDTRFYVALQDPGEDGRYIVLDFGYNPMVSKEDLGFVSEVGIGNDLQRAGVSTFELTSKPKDAVDATARRCEPRRGELCAGIGVYEPDHFDPEHDVAGIDGARFYDHYFPARSGELTIHDLSSIHVHVAYRIDPDWDTEGSSMDMGAIRGCFRAARTRTQDGEVLR